MIRIRHAVMLLLCLATALSCCGRFAHQPRMTSTLQDCAQGPCTLRVTVINEKGQAMPGAIVRLLVGPGEQVIKAVTRPTGDVEISGLIAGPPCVLIVDCPGYFPFVEEQLYLHESASMHLTVRVTSAPT